ncbi:MAG: ammonium transporter [Streptosporangiaceae bacterium]
MSLLLRERDTSRIALPARASVPRTGLRRAEPRWTGLTRRSARTSRSNLARTRYRPRNNREIPLKLAHGTHALQVYGAAGVEPAQKLDPRRPYCPHGGIVNPYPSWLSAGDNSWQMTAATLVGLMSIPALAVLYGGLVQKKWAMNTVLMVFTTFCLVLITWVLWAFKMGFGTPLISTFVGDPRSVLGHTAEQGQANIPLLNGLMPNFRFPESSLVYFQFVFAAITPILFIGSVIGRISFRVWMIFVPLWITFAYAVNAFLLWGGGYWAGKGALDFSGGYVIHLAAGVSGFVAAAVVGPRLKRDRERAIPNNLMFVAVGAGILWLGWNGFNGGDPYFASQDAAAAVINTNLATAVAMMTWIIMDMAFSPEKKPTFLGGLNGMICGLVGITPAAGYVNGLGAIIIGLVCSAIVWVAWMYLPKYVWPFNKVDDALGVVYTHGIAGLFGGLLVGLLADPNMIVYLGLGKNPSVSGAGLFYGHGHQLLVQAGAALTIIVWDAAVTFVILMVIKYVFRMNLRLPDDQLEIGDVAVHGEEAYPSEDLVSVGSSMADEASPTSREPEKAATADDI